jgi:hypothetical protein
MVLCESDPKSLAGLLALADSQIDPWDEAELAAILQSFLVQPLPSANSKLRPLAANRASHALCPRTVGELLRHPTPPITLLKQVKEQAKADRRSLNPAQPAKVNLAIYYSCIAAALVRCQVSISTLSGQKLGLAFARLAEESWMDRELTILLRQADAAVRPAGST